MNAKTLVLCLFFFSVLAFAAPKEDFEDVVVVKWIDGDTLEVRPEKGRAFKVRVWGIDAPEIDQPWGKESKFFAEKDVPSGGKIRICKRGRDRYGRTLADVKVIAYGRRGDGWYVDFAPTHVRWGNAWANRQFKRKGDTSSRLIAAEEKARDNRNGLWDTNKSPIPPWEWRKKKGKQ